MKLFLPVFLAIAAVAMSAEPNTNQIRKIGPRNLRVITNAPTPPKSSVAKTPATLGPRYDVSISPGTAIIITSTNTFTTAEARRWLMEAIRTLR